jgi:hypothetical protein
MDGTNSRSLCFIFIFNLKKCGSSSIKQRDVRYDKRTVTIWQPCYYDTEKQIKLAFSFFSGFVDIYSYY